MSLLGYNETTTARLQLASRTEISDMSLSFLKHTILLALLHPLDRIINGPSSYVNGRRHFSSPVPYSSATLCQVVSAVKRLLTADIRDSLKGS